MKGVWRLRPGVRTGNEDDKGPTGREGIGVVGSGVEGWRERTGSRDEVADTTVTTSGVRQKE